MISEASQASLEVFLSYDFKNEKKKRIGIKTGNNNEKTLVLFSKKTSKINDSLTKIAHLVTKNLEEWNQKKETLNLLELQCAWLERKVEEHDAKTEKKKIDFKNPYGWILTLRLSFAQSDQIKILSEDCKKKYYFDRLTTQGDVRNIVIKFIDGAVVSYQLKNKSDTLSDKANKIFSEFNKDKKPSIKEDSVEPFLSIDNPGEDQEIKVTAEKLKQSILKELAQKHTAKKEQRKMESSSEDEGAADQVDDGSTNYTPFIAVIPPPVTHHSHHHHSPASSSTYQHSCASSAPSHHHSSPSYTPSYTHSCASSSTTHHHSCASSAPTHHHSCASSTPSYTHSCASASFSHHH